MNLEPPDPMLVQSILCFPGFSEVNSVAIIVADRYLKTNDVRDRDIFWLLLMRHPLEFWARNCILQKAYEACESKISLPICLEIIFSVFRNNHEVQENWKTKLALTSPAQTEAKIQRVLKLPVHTRLHCAYRDMIVYAACYGDVSFIRRIFLYPGAMTESTWNLAMAMAHKRNHFAVKECLLTCKHISDVP